MKPARLCLSIFLALFIALQASSQLSVIIFSEKGEKFTAYLNTVPKNDKPAARVETDRPGGPSFKLRISFEDSSIPEISKTIFNSPGPDMYYVIRKSDKGKFLLEKTSSEYVHHDAATPAAEDKTAVKEEKSTTQEPNNEPKPAGEKKRGCNNPMEEPNFIASREMISNAPFDGPKLSQAKNMADKNCLTTSQIINMLYVFSGESARLSFAKYAYNHCWDPDNYNQVKDDLRPSSREDLQRHIDSLK